jgi:hypothetical protein
VARSTSQQQKISRKTVLSVRSDLAKRKRDLQS